MNDSEHEETARQAARSSVRGGRGSRVVLALTAIWTVAFLLANTFEPHIRDSRTLPKLYAAIAMHVRTAEFHVGVVFLLIAGVVACRRRWRCAMLLAIVGACGVAPEVRHAWPRRDNLPADGQPIRLISLNNYRRRDNAPRVAAMLREQSPDLVAFAEYSAACDSELAAAVGDAYPYRVVHPMESSRGVALYSRWPILNTRPLVGGPGFERFFESTVDVRGRPVRVIVAHFTSPQSPDMIWMNRIAVDECAKLVRADPATPTIVAGDLNFPFHSQQSDVFRHARLAHVDDRAGWGLRWSWMPLSTLPVTRIDHAFVSPQFAVADSRVLGRVRSDHLPIVVDLVLRPRIE